MTALEVNAAVAVFVFTYVVIAARRRTILNLNRPTAVLVGALLMVLASGMPVEAAYAAIDLNTLTLLLGMMLVAAYLTMSGFFAWVAWRIQARAGTPGRVLALLMLAAAGLSALFVNDTICLLMTPLVLQVTAKRDPVPYLLGLVTASNIGGMSTLIGNPQNMLIGMYSGIEFGAFFARMAPIALVCLGVAYVVLRRAYPAELSGAWRHDDVAEPPLDRAICGRILAIVLLMLVALLVPAGPWLPFAPQYRLPMVALTGGALAVIFGRYDPDRALSKIEWSLLLFFAGLFIVVEGLARTGLVTAAHTWLGPLTSGVAGFSVLSVVLSNLVSNVPFVVVAQHWMGAYPDPTKMWYVLSMSCTLAGNLTILGSVANVIVLELARERVHIGFWEYLKVGLPITVVTVAIGAVALSVMA